jgi:transposase InsO family protein
MAPVKWSYFYLYVILDIFSRRVVGWRVEHAESATLFKALFIDAMTKHDVPPDQLTLQANHCRATDEGEDNSTHAGRSWRAQIPQSSAYLER